MAKFTSGTTPIDFFDFGAELQDLDDGTTASIHTTTQLRRDEVIPTDYVDFFGSKFVYDGSFNLTSGTVNRIVSVASSLVQWDLSSLTLTDAQLDTFITAGDGQAFLGAVFAGNDSITGSTGNDTLQGFAGNDTFNGGKGDDVFHVDDSKDVVVESLTFATGGGTDLVISKGTFTLGTNVDNLQLLDGAKADGTGNAIANTLTGNSSDNKLTGLAGSDSLDGGAGKDTLDGGTGDDTMVGGEDDDLYIQDSAGDVITENGANVGLGDTLKTNQQLTDTTLTSNIEHYIFTGTKSVDFTGSAAKNSITGTAAIDTLRGDAGDDTLIGLGGNDSLDGGDDNDSLDGGLGMDTMRGGDGDDTYGFDNAKDVVDETGTDGNDTVNASVTVTLASFVGIENITLTGAGAINATGNDEDNVLKGNSGANKLDGVVGDDTMDGGKGADIYTVGSEDDQVSENDALDGGGIDTVISSVTHTLTPNIENLTLAPGLANIDGTGNALANTLTGNDGNNLLDGKEGIDKLVGGKGNDTYVVDDLKDTVTESVAAGGGDDLVQSKVTFTLGANLERLELIDGKDADGTGNTLANSLTGNIQNNKLSGMTGDDSLLGKDGNDTLDGGAGNDTMEGGAGNDLYIVDSAFDVVNPDTGGSDELKTNQLLAAAIGGIENYTFTGTKAVIFDASDDNTDNRITGTSAADTFRAKGGDDSLAGLAGNDTLVGGDDNDTIDGGTGTDSMDGGDGDDTYTVDNIKDVIADSGGTDTVVASVSFDLSTFGVEIENASLTGTGALNLTGDKGDNKLTGNAGANKIDGKEGADDMVGGKGNDTYTVDNVGDKVTEAANEGASTVFSSVDFILGNNLENLTLTDKDLNTGKSVGDIDGTGGTPNNLIIGNSGANILRGGVTSGNDTTPNGNDTLIGNGGDDSLSGGAGADSLSGGDGNDTLDGGASADKSDLAGDKMAGGAGDDVYYINTSKDTVTEAANAGRDTVFSSVGHTLGANVEDLVLLKETTGLGNTLSNKITGSDVSDTSVDASGDDRINGFAGDDTLLGMSGEDTLIGFTGNDSIDGGDGLDIAQFAGKSTDYQITTDVNGVTTVVDLKAAVNGDDGTDKFVNVEFLEFLGDKLVIELHAKGTSGPDDKLLTAVPEGFDGLEGNDTLRGMGGNDTLDGDGDNDLLIGGAGDDNLAGGTGTDEYDHAGTSVDGNDLVNTGDNGLDKVVFTGSNLFDLDFKREDTDLVVGAVKTGQITFDGSVRVVDHYAGAAIASVLIDTQFNGLYGTDLNQAKFVFTTDLKNGIDNTTFTEVLLGNGKSELINGNGGFLDILAGNVGDDTLNGGAGDDWLRGGAGIDSLDGGSGINTADYSTAAAGTGVTVSLLTGTAAADGDGGTDTLTNIQNVRGSAGADSITGSAGDNVFEGGAGNDTFDGGAGTDQGDYSKATSKVTIDLTDSTATGDLSVGTDNLESIERVLGSQFSDSIKGAAGVFAELVGSKGGDTIDGAGSGYASYYDSPGAVTADLGAGKATNDGWGTADTLTLNSLVGLTGSAFNDKLTGNAGVNTLDGGAGDDTVTGGAGNDSIVGGLGTDTAVFSGKSGDYLITDIGGGKVTVKDLVAAGGDDGTDTLSGIEAFQFSDATIDEDNDAPVNTVPGAQNTNEDTALVFSSGKLISVSDLDADGADIQVVLHVDHGTLDVVNASGLVITNDKSGDVTLTGTLIEINAGLNGLIYTPTLNYNGSDTLKITTEDLGHTGKGGSKTDVDTIAITINPGNDNPDAVNDTGTTGENTTLTVNATNGVLKNDTDVDGDSLTVSAVTGGTVGVQFALASGALLTLNADGSYVYNPNSKFEALGVGENGADSFTYTISDGHGGTDTATVNLTITGVNDAPVAVDDTGTTGENTTLTVNAANGVLKNDTDIDGDTLTVSAVTGGTVGVQFALASGALLTLNADGSYVYNPNGKFEALGVGKNGADSFTYSISDGHGGTDTATVNLTITGVNDAPDAVNDTGTTDENTKLTVAAKGVLSNDTDIDSGDVLTVSAVNGAAGNVGKQFSLASGALLTLNADGSYVYDPNGKFESLAAGKNGSDSFTYTISDGHGGGDTATVNLTITGVNDSPVITSNGGGPNAAVNVDENSMAVTTVTASDPDASATLTYSISGGADQLLFAINATTGALSFIAPPNFESPADQDKANLYDVQVKVSDGSLSDTQSIAVTVTNVNEAPLITSNGGGDTAAFSVAENQTAVTTVMATDVDAGATLVYSISGGLDALLFDIDPDSGVLTFKSAPNFEAPADNGPNNVYNVTVTAFDGSLSDTQDIAVTVTNVGESVGAVSDTNGAANTVAENAITGTLVGITAFADDPDAGQTVSYSLTKDESLGGFKIDATTGIVTVNDGSKLDFDTDASHVITVKATSTDGTSSTKDFTIALTNVDEPVGAVSDTNGAANTVAENAITGTLVGITAFADDPDAGQTVSYSLTKDESLGGFKIDVSTGIVSVDNGALLDFDTDASHVITVKATSTDGTSSTKDFTIALTNVDEPVGAVSDTNGAANTVAENAIAGTLVGITAFADDPDAGQTVSYSLTKDESLGGFKIDATTGIVSVDNGALLDFDTDASHVITVKATSTDGTSSTKDFTIALTNVDEPVGAVSDTNGAANTVAENAITGTLVGITAFADDPDAGQTVSYSLTKDESLGGFKIDATTGIVTVNDSSKLDFDTDASHVITVKATSTDGTSSTHDFTIALTNVDEPVGAVSDTNGAANTVAENAITGTLVGITAFADDPDAGQTVSYGLTKDESLGGFKIDSTTGIVTVDDGSKLDFETDSSHIITVKATSTDGSSSTKDFTITLTDVIGETLDGDGNANKLVGGIGDDSLSGLAGNDMLSGGVDSDTLVGGDDDDQLTGGAGADTFQFSLASAAGQDTIADFDHTKDVLHFQDVFDTGTAGLDLDDLNAAITTVLDSGPGNDVTVTFTNTASIVFQGVGTGSINSIDDLVDNTAQIVIT